MEGLFRRFLAQFWLKILVSRIFCCSQPPCIMCVQYRGGCSVPWGDIMSTVGGYLEYRGGCSVPWGDIMINVGGYLEYRGGVQYRGGIS